MDVRAARLSTLISWVLGNFLGGLAGYYRENRILKAIGIVATGLQPIPNYIVAFVAPDRLRLRLADLADQRRRRR